MAPPAALAQQAQPAQPAVDPAFTAAKAAFEALPPEERKAIQEDLIWAGSYRSTLDGGFGRGTFGALTAFETAAKLKSDGILEPAERKALATAAEALRKKTGFREITDKPSGATLKIPATLLAVSTPRKGGTLWADAAKTVGLSTESYGADTSLQALFDRMKADIPGRKVSYSVLKPDWFVLTAEAGTRRTYSRFVAVGGGLRGFTWSYDAANPDGERIAVAIANSFEQTAETVASGDAAPAKPAAPAEVAAKPVATETIAIPAVPATPVATKSAALSGFTAFLVAPGRALASAAALAACKAPTIGGKPAAAVAATDALVLLDAGTLKPDAELMLRTVSLEPGGSVLALAQSTQGAAPQLAVATGDLAMAGDDGLRFTAALPRGGAGAPLFDRSGALAAIILATARDPQAIGGMVPESAHPLVSSETITAFLAKSGINSMGQGSAGLLSAGQIAGRLGHSVIAVACAK